MSKKKAKFYWEMFELAKAKLYPYPSCMKLIEDEATLIVKLLRNSSPKGLTTSEINNSIGSKSSVCKLGMLLQALENDRYILSKEQSVNGFFAKVYTYNLDNNA